eukprot:6213416-Pleurochrysis_carterae.AAC.11
MNKLVLKIVIEVFIDILQFCTSTLVHRCETVTLTQDKLKRYRAHNFCTSGTFTGGTTIIAEE